MTMGDDRLFFLGKDRMICLSLENGKELWTSEFANPTRMRIQKVAIVRPKLSKSPPPV